LPFRIGPALAASGGTLLVYSGLTGKNWSKTLGSLITTGKAQTTSDYQLTSVTNTGGSNYGYGSYGYGQSPGNVSGNAKLAEQMAAALYGWTGNQWTALYNLWTRESGFSNTAENSSSGAYGIAQALGHGPTNQYPGGTYAAANPPPYGSSSASAQIAWGLMYIKETYGSPEAAWAHEESEGWY
jgi:hypothetical protein